MVGIIVEELEDDLEQIFWQQGHKLRLTEYFNNTCVYTIENLHMDIEDEYIDFHDCCGIYTRMILRSDLKQIYRCRNDEKTSYELVFADGKIMIEVIE
jgi:hypothetical protein